MPNAAARAVQAVNAERGEELNRMRHTLPVTPEGTQFHQDRHAAARRLRPQRGGTASAHVMRAGKRAQEEWSG